MKKISAWWKDMCVHGIHLPFAHDPVTGKPSVTLLFPYITFVICMMSMVLLQFKPELVLSTGMTLVFWAASVIFYMFRKLHKAKFDVKDGSFELESGDNNE